VSALTSLSSTRSIPIFVITGEPAAKHKDLCIGLGAKEYFEKPTDFKQLKECLAATIKLKQPERRDGARVQLKVILKLRGVDVNGITFEVLTTTENVSANGFYCGLEVRLEKGSIVDVFHVTEGERFVERARVVRKAWQITPLEHYGFEFTRNSSNWVLR
jgi:response regulator RpfG family c-di-GMP phosphodiesterase